MNEITNPFENKVEGIIRVSSDICRFTDNHDVITM